MSVFDNYNLTSTSTGNYVISYKILDKQHKVIVSKARLVQALQEMIHEATIKFRDAAALYHICIGQNLSPTPQQEEKLRQLISYSEPLSHLPCDLFTDLEDQAKYTCQQFLKEYNKMTGENISYQDVEPYLSL